MKTYDPYVSLVGKRVRIQYVAWNQVSGKLLQTTNKTISLQGKKNRRVIKKDHILETKEITESKKDDSAQNHLRRSK